MRLIFFSPMKETIGAVRLDVCKWDGQAATGEPQRVLALLNVSWMHAFEYTSDISPARIHQGGLPMRDGRGTTNRFVCRRERRLENIDVQSSHPGLGGRIDLGADERWTVRAEIEAC